MLGGLIEEDPEAAWAVLLDLVAQAPDEDVLAVFGAGPLEDFLCVHAAGYITAIEATAAVNPRFRQALGCAWMWNSVPEPIFDRLAGAAASDLDRPRSPEEAAARRRSDARFEELAQRIDRLVDPDSPGNSQELHDALGELHEFLGLPPPEE